MIRARRDLNAIWRLMREAGHRQIIGGLLLASLAVLSGAALLGLAGWFITATALAGLSLATALTFDVFAPSAGIRLLALSRTALRYGERLVTHDATFRVLAVLRERLFHGWAARSAARFLMLRPAKVLFRLTQDIDALDSLYLRLIAPAVAAVLTALIAGLALGLMHPLLGIGVAALLLATGLGIPVAVGSTARRISRRHTYATETLRAQTIDLVRGQTELAMIGQLHARQRTIARADLMMADADDALNRIDTKLSIGFGVVGALLLSVTLLTVAMLAEAKTIGAPVATLAVLLVLGVMEPFSGLRRGALELGRTLLAAQRIAPRLAPPPATPLADAPRSGIAAELVDVTVRYPTAHCATLAKINLTIDCGARIALIGPSGAGKSTLLAVLAGEIEADSGHVARAHATLFTQRTELFQDSLRDNIRLARPDADDTRILEAIAVAGLTPTVARLPSGIETPLGEGGLGLSGGEARRLALARLLLRDSPLWLLDEPTAGVDGVTARDVLHRLVEHAGNRAIVIATHVRREAELADHLVIMRNGCIVSQVARGEPEFDQRLAALRPD